MVLTVQCRRQIVNKYISMLVRPRQSVTVAVKEIRRWRDREARHALKHRVVKAGFSEEVTFVLRPEGGETTSLGKS